MTNWFYRQNHQDLGPLPGEQLIALYQAGEITSTTLIRAADSPIWQQLNATDIGRAVGDFVETAETEDGEILTVNPSRVRPLKAGYYTLYAGLALYIAVAATSVMGTLAMQFGMFRSDAGQMSRFMLASAILPPAYAATFILSIFGYCGFVHQAMANLRHLGAREARMKPVMAWLWHFVPLFNLFKPFQAMRQIWFGSHHNAGRAEPHQGVLIAWWVFWIGSVFVVENFDLVFDRFTGDSSLMLYYVGSLGMIASAITLLIIVHRIYQLQSHEQTELTARVFD